MVRYLPRSAWRARPPNGGPGTLTPSRVQGAVIHWPGTGTSTGIHSQAAVASALRGWQNFHMDDRGWSDIAYQVAVDQAGRAWALRGLRVQSGANGNSDLNERYGAILLVLVTGEQPTAAMKATTRGVIADFRRIFPRGTAIRPHSAVRPDGTDCPGPAARAAIARGDFTPTSEDVMTPAQMQELKNFIEARSQAYALWVHKALRRDLSAVVQAYALDIKKYEAQTDAADAQRAAVAVWAMAPDDFDPKPTPEPGSEPDPETEPYLLLPDPDPMPTVDTTPEAGPDTSPEETAPDAEPAADGSAPADAAPVAAGQPESGADPEPNPAPKQ